VALRTSDDPETLARTRAAWHTLAERVVAPVRQRATGRIGLRPEPGGFGTGPLPTGPSVRVDGVELVVGASRAPISTLGAAATFAGLPGPADLAVYPTTTPTDASRPLPIDPDAAAILAGWFAFGAAVLDQWVQAASTADAPSEPQLWPEHFDLALALGPEGHRANYGASPGDAATPGPYLYVGPWARRSGPFWDAGTYARLGLDSLASVDDPAGRAVEFFATGHRLA
jgi:hypothetical protein